MAGLFLVPCAQGAQAPEQESSFAAAPACEIAERPPCYVNNPKFPVGEEMQKKFSAYRQGWQDLCRRKPGSSLHALLEQSYGLRETYPDFERIEAMSKTLSQCLPGFEWYLGVVSYFRPSPTVFAKNAALGDREDQEILPAFAKLNGNNAMWPWIKQTGDMGGCTQYGHYDWVAALKALQDLKDHIHTPIYQNMLKPFETQMMQAFNGDRYRDKFICTCGDKDAVLQDLRKVDAYLVDHAAGSSASQKVRAMIKALENGTIKIKSESQNHC
jgi:hypothetical protein